MPFCRTQDSQMGSSSGCPGSSQNPDSGQKEPSGSKAVLRKNVLSWYPAHTWGKGMEREGEVIRKKQRKMSRGKDEQGGELDHSCLKKDVLSPVWFKPERGKQHVGPPPPPQLASSPSSFQGLLLRYFLGRLRHPWGMCWQAQLQIPKWLAPLDSGGCGWCSACAAPTMQEYL